MIEPEMAFYDLNDNMDLAEDFLKYLIKYALDHCMDDLKFLSARLQEEEKTKKAEERSMELIEKLNFVLTHDFERLSYTEAVEILKNSPKAIAPSSPSNCPLTVKLVALPKKSCL